MALEPAIKKKRRKRKKRLPSTLILGGKGETRPPTRNRPKKGKEESPPGNVYLPDPRKGKGEVHHLPQDGLPRGKKSPALWLS